MLGFTRLPLSKYRRVLQVPEFISSVVIAPFGEGRHVVVDRLIIRQPQHADLHQITIRTLACAIRSLWIFTN